tara:strand:- start:107 stop:805 length:699 start_codon:yes stop_codon:yes gene_type:complete
MERLVRKSEFQGALDFIQRLRSRCDPKPKFIAPPTEFKNSAARTCIVNAVAYCEQHPDHEPVRGFKLWVNPLIPTHDATCHYVAVVHFVARHKETGRYVDVTPADPGDEGQEMLFVPSSRLYSEWTAPDIAACHTKGLEPRMGSICSSRQVLLFKQSIEGEALHKSKPEELQLLLCPMLTTVRKDLGGLEVAPAKCILKGIGASFVKASRSGTEYCIVDATKYRSVCPVQVS